MVLDDGSHVMAHVRASLAALFPALAPGGLYLIEDMHTAYWPAYGGDPGSLFRQKRNFFRDLIPMIDDMHRPYHGRPDQVPGIGAAVSGLHVHDSIVVLEKGPVFPPVHSVVGG